MNSIGSISSASVSSSASNLQNQVQVDVLKKSMDLEKMQSQTLLQSLGIGKNIDISA